MLLAIKNRLWIWGNIQELGEKVTATPNALAWPHYTIPHQTVTLKHHNHAYKATYMYIELKSRYFCGGYYFIRPPLASIYSYSLYSIVSINLSISS